MSFNICNIMTSSVNLLGQPEIRRSWFQTFTMRLFREKQGLTFVSVLNAHLIYFVLNISQSCELEPRKDANMFLNVPVSMVYWFLWNNKVFLTGISDVIWIFQRLSLIKNNFGVNLQNVFSPFSRKHAGNSSLWLWEKKESSWENAIIGNSFTVNPPP